MDVEELESFSLQTDLSNELTLLSLFTIGLSQYTERDWDGAIDSFTRALNNYNDHPSARELFNYRGMTYRYAYKYEQAIADFSRAIELDPNYASAYNNRGMSIFEHLGDYDSAISDINQAILAKPGNVQYYHNRSVLNYDQAHEEGHSKDYHSQVIRDATQAINLEPEGAMNHFLRGMSYYWINEYEASLADLDKAISLFNEERTSEDGKGANDKYLTDAYVVRGNINFLKDDLISAMADYNNAVHISPNDYRGHEGRGGVYMKIGEFPDAITNLNRALELTSDSENRQQIQNELDEVIEALNDQ